MEKIGWDNVSIILEYDFWDDTSNLLLADNSLRFLNLGRLGFADIRRLNVFDAFKRIFIVRMFGVALWMCLGPLRDFGESHVQDADISVAKANHGLLLVSSFKR